MSETKSVKTNARTITRLEREQFDAAIGAAAEQYPLGNPEGVLGATIARRYVHGRAKEELTVALLVERKVEAPDSPIGAITFEHEGKSYSLAPDVQAVGVREPATRGGIQVPYSGLHAGCSILTDGGEIASIGAAACLLGSDHGPTHLLTAGHLFPRGAEGMRVLAAMAPGQTPVMVGKLEMDLLDHKDTSGGARDLALVELSRAGLELAKASAERPRHPRLRSTPFDCSSLAGAELRAFLPLRGDYVPVSDASVEPGYFIIKWGARPPFALQGEMMKTSYAHNQRGDSGAPLMTDEDVPGRIRDIGSAVAVIIGAAGGTSLYEPVDRALRLIAAATGRPLRIF